MGTFHFNCAECDQPTSAATDSPQARDELCYKHYVAGISFGFRGVGGGQESFHNDTYAEYHKEALEGAAEQGREVRVKNKVNGSFL